MLDKAGGDGDKRVHPHLLAMKRWLFGEIESRSGWGFQFS